MSVFSIIQRAEQQQFALQMKGKSLPSARTLPADKTEERDEKAADKTKQLAETLVATTSSSNTGGGNASQNSKDADILKDFKDAVDLNSTLSRAVKDGADAERQLRIERLTQQIERMKEMLKFVTPEKAEKMLKELQQLAKTFRTASIELRKAAEKIGPDLPNAAVDVAADATALALTNPQQAQADLLDTVSKITDTLLARLQGPATTPASLDLSPAGEQRVKTIKTPASRAESGHEAFVSTQPSAKTSPVYSGQDKAGNEKAVSQPLAASREDSLPVITGFAGVMTELQGAVQRANDAAFNTAAVYAYADLQHQSDTLYRQGRKETMRAEHEQLTKIFEELKMLAKSLEALVDMEDEENRERMLDVLVKLLEGFTVLDDDDLKQFLGVGEHTPLAADGAENGTRTISSSMVVSSVSVETSVSITISTSGAAEAPTPALGAGIVA
ncbi:hypothetical protein JM93_03811 [Roseibium hamelinense]|uniref:Uncharacterized protein n=1 Tax=Roseibium hamelinense TaxID=150831 RepID=A0A562SKN6_9HYPH|nr:hypothetical protein [Roseibium hamelinense]MTI43225.1 hypothetical protein [Roseibium hamelinense]TWI81849.1 hypothetical protein JM93_03811 [Roseibium hamelinense]